MPGLLRAIRYVRDVGLLTADPTLTADVSHLFNLLTGYSRRAAYETMMVAPLDLRRRMLASTVCAMRRRRYPGQALADRGGAYRCIGAFASRVPKGKFAPGEPAAARAGIAMLELGAAQVRALSDAIPADELRIGQKVLARELVAEAIAQAGRGDAQPAKTARNLQSWWNCRAAVCREDG